MANYRPVEADQMTTPLKLQKPVYKVVGGVTKVDYFEDVKEPFFYGSFKTYGGTETNVNDVYAIKDTASIVCFYRPDINSSSRIIRLTDGATFKVIAEPENTDQRNQFLKIKVERVKGGV